MAVAQRLTTAEYEQFVHSAPDGLWELHDGQLVEKPGMSWEHLDTISELAYLLRRQLDRSEYRVFVESRVRRPEATIFLPDVAVVPTSYGEEFRGRPGTLAIFSGPLPLVIEVWSLTTGDSDVDAKLPVYQQRGDLEIWRIHPYERTLTRWIRQPDDAYDLSVHRTGTVSPIALPGVTIDLNTFFAS